MLESIFASDGLAIWLDQGQVFPAAVEPEIGVQFGADKGTVLVRSEHDQVAVGRQCRIRKSPLCQVVPIVREEPSIQVNGCRFSVVNFDPI
jgi:hypothetical protein